MKVLVTGGSGLVGKALQQVTFSDWVFPTSKECDLTDRTSVLQLFDTHRPDVVVHLASKCGGVKLHKEYKVEFMRDNIRMNENVMEACHVYKVQKAIICLSSVILKQAPLYCSTCPALDSSYGRSYYYSKLMALLEIENYNQQYGTCFIPLTVPNLYGVGDRMDPEIAHVVPSLITKISNAKIQNTLQLSMFGSSHDQRYFMNSIDVAKVIEHLVYNQTDTQLINIVPPQKTYICELVDTICKVIGYTGIITYQSEVVNDIPTIDTSIFNKIYPNFTFTILEDGIKSIVTSL